MDDIPEGGRLDLAFCLGLILAGGWYLWDAPRWAATVYVGSDQYGDAQFWWDGALHFSRGIVADNPNLLYRMGYAAFAGAIAAVTGPNFLAFHKVLLGLFLALAAGMYCQLAAKFGRLAAAAAALLLVFNPYTAEWLAISSSDSLGMVLNLAALLALGRGLAGRSFRSNSAAMAEAGRPAPNPDRGESKRWRVPLPDALHLGWLAAFGLLLAGASLTRPLMTPMILPAGLAVWAAAGWRFRPALPGWAAIAGPFFALTFAWMGFIGALSGNFAISGSSQDSSIFYAASDPRIQVWRPDMYAAVEDAARRRFHTAHLTASQTNREFWTLTAENYRRNWRHHFGRFWSNIAAVGEFTPRRATAASPSADRWRLAAKSALILSLAGLAAARRRWKGAVAAAILGAAWVFWPPFHLVALLAAGLAGIAGLLVRPRSSARWQTPYLLAFIWAAYWWIGVMVTYLTGGTWGPPLGATTDLNALGYRLGFQFFFAADVLIVGGLAYISSGWSALTSTRLSGRGAQPARWGQRAPPQWLRLTAISAAALLLILLLAGAGIIGWRMIERSRTKPVAYPGLALLSRAWPKASPAGNIAGVRSLIAAATGAGFATTAMSSGFVWNLEGQERCMLWLYQQEAVRPVRMMPNWLMVEVPRHLPESLWRMRQGAWLIRSFPDAPVASNLPYYFEVPAVQAFVPLSPDGRSFDLGRAAVFPLAKYASQLAASGEMRIEGANPVWAHDSGGAKRPRRFGLRPVSGTAPIAIDLELGRAIGRRILRFGWQVERAGPPPSTPVELSLRPPLWHALSNGSEPAVTWATIPLGELPSAGFTGRNLAPADTLWLYEFVLTADDFSP